MVGHQAGVQSAYTIPNVLRTDQDWAAYVFELCRGGYQNRGNCKEGMPRSYCGRPMSTWLKDGLRICTWNYPRLTICYWAETLKNYKTVWDLGVPTQVEWRNHCNTSLAPWASERLNLGVRTMYTIRPTLDLHCKVKSHAFTSAMGRESSEIEPS